MLAAINVTATTDEWTEIVLPGSTTYNSYSIKALLPNIHLEMKKGESDTDIWTVPPDPDSYLAEMSVESQTGYSGGETLCWIKAVEKSVDIEVFMA